MKNQVSIKAVVILVLSGLAALSLASCSGKPSPTVFDSPAPSPSSAPRGSH